MIVYGLLFQGAEFGNWQASIAHFARYFLAFDR